MFLECCEANEGRTAMYHEAGELTVHLRLQGCTGHRTEALCSLSIEAIVEDWSDISQMCLSSVATASSTDNSESSFFAAYAE